MFNYKESLHYRYFVGSGKVLTDATKSTGDLKALQLGMFNPKNYSALPLGTSSKAVPEVIIAYGSPNETNKIHWTNVTNSVKTVPIRADKLISWRKSTPKRAKQHKVAIGWDGVTDCKTITADCEQTYELHLRVSGSPASRYLAQKPLTETFSYSTPCCGDDCASGGCTANVEDMVDSLVTQINSNPDIAPFVKAEKLVSYTNPPTVLTVDYTKYILVIADSGSFVDLANVQVAYPDYEVIRESRDGIYSTYSMIVPNADGAPDNFVTNAPIKIANCTDCPSGYTLVDDETYKFKVTRTDDGTSGNLTTFQTDYTAEAKESTAVRISYQDGVSTYTIYGSSATSPISGAIAGDTVTLIGTFPPYCLSDGDIEVAWEDDGAWFKVLRDLCLVLGDEPCDDASGTDQLAAIEAFYAGDATVEPNSISQTDNGECANSYIITQISKNLLEEGCTTGIPEWDDLQPFKGFKWGDCACEVVTPNEIANIGIVLTGAYVDTTFGDCAFEYSDFVELDLLKITVVQGNTLDELGKCNSSWDVTELQKPEYPTGTGENIKRNYIDAVSLLHQCYSDSPREREIYGLNYDFIDRKKFYKTFYLEFEALDKYNKNTGYGGMDIRTTVTFVFPEDADTSDFENLLEGWMSATRPDLISADSKYNAYR